MVDLERMLVVVPKVVQAVNDKQQVLPMLAQLQALPAGLNGAKGLTADAGFSATPIGRSGFVSRRSWRPRPRQSSA